MHPLYQSTDRSVPYQTTRYNRVKNYCATIAIYTNLFAEYRIFWSIGQSLWSISCMPIKCAYSPEKSVHKSHEPADMHRPKQQCIALLLV